MAKLTQLEAWTSQLAEYMEGTQQDVADLRTRFGRVVQEMDENTELMLADATVRADILSRYATERRLRLA